jgi:hypothetical protein
MHEDSLARLTGSQKGFYGHRTASRRKNLTDCRTDSTLITSAGKINSTLIIRKSL